MKAQDGLPASSSVLCRVSLFDRVWKSLRRLVRGHVMGLRPRHHESADRSRLSPGGCFKTRDLPYIATAFPPFIPPPSFFLNAKSAVFRPIFATCSPPESGMYFRARLPQALLIAHLSGYTGLPSLSEKKTCMGTSLVFMLERI